MAEHCKDKLMAEGLLIPKSVQPRHPSAVPKMDTIERGGSYVPQERYKYQVHAYCGLGTLGATTVQTFFHSIPACFLHGSDSHCTD